MFSKNVEKICQTLFDYVRFMMTQLDLSKLIWIGFEVWPLFVHFILCIILIPKNTKNMFDLSWLLIFISLLFTIDWCWFHSHFIIVFCLCHLNSHLVHFIFISFLLLFSFDQWVNDLWLALTYERLNLLWSKSNSTWSKIKWIALCPR